MVGDERSRHPDPGLDDSHAVPKAKDCQVKKGPKAGPGCFVTANPLPFLRHISDQKTYPKYHRYAICDRSVHGSPDLPEWQFGLDRLREYRICAKNRVHELVGAPNSDSELGGL